MIDDVMMLIFSTACAIELADTVVVTGGYDVVITFDFLAKVEVYDTFGPKEQLPDLLTPRAYHACAHYVDSDNRVVSLALHLLRYSMFVFQAYLVTGGLLSFLPSDSTELLVQGASSWTSSAPLPSPRSSLRAATLSNKIVATGTPHFSYSYIAAWLIHCIAGGVGHWDWDSSAYTKYDDILEFDEEKLVWNKIGSMSINRYDHAVTVINYLSIVDYCNGN